MMMASIEGRDNLNGGFTLLEVVAVMAVASVLASGVLAVVGRARANTRRTVCQTHLKQLALGVQQYVKDYDGRFPMREPQESLLPYVDERETFLCPSASEKEAAFTNHYLLSRALVQIDFDAHKVWSRHESTVSNSASTLLFSETIGATENFSGFCVRNQDYNIPHLGGANYAFLDTHVKWMTTSQFVELACSTPLIP